MMYICIAILVYLLTALSSGEIFSSLHEKLKNKVSLKQI